MSREPRDRMKAAGQQLKGRRRGEADRAFPTNRQRTASGQTRATSQELRGRGRAGSPEMSVSPRHRDLSEYAFVLAGRLDGGR